MDFDVDAAVRAGDAGVLGRQDEMLDRVAREADGARKATREFAQHLADGGDPTEFKTTNVPSFHYAPLVSEFFGLIPVYEEWNKARGSDNVVLPFQNHDAWRLAEYMLDRLDEPVLYATLVDVVRAGRFHTTKPSSDTIAQKLMEAQGEKFVLRKTKVDGKVAYLLREKREGEEPVTSSWAVPDANTGAVPV